jgi:phenylacetate-coenzyme A ligase PaaK-like adenylate-forming protein
VAGTRIDQVGAGGAAEDLRPQAGPALHLADLQAYLEQPGAGPVFGGRYWVAATSGGSGHKAIIPASAAEWAAVIASCGRASEWTGVRAGPAHPVRMAVVSSATPWHQSARVAASVRSPFIATKRPGAGWPPGEIVIRLSTLRPDVLMAYASMVRTLAAGQIAGRLAISPRAVNSSSEVLTAKARAMAGRLARPAVQRLRGHRNRRDRRRMPPPPRPAPVRGPGHPRRRQRRLPAVLPGEPGTRLLVTVLARRTIPLIRYPDDRPPGPGPRPGPMRASLPAGPAIEGRTDDALPLPAAHGGTIAVHPVVFRKVLDLLDAVRWQVR